jgi:DNA-binding response OmpR family regulator
VSISNQKQKILAIGSAMMEKRLSAKVDQNAFEITGCRSLEDAADLLEYQPFDMVIVDNLINNARQICRSTAALSDSPVALLLQEKPVNWRGLEQLKVDGFLADGGTNAELMARLRALMRRKIEPCCCRND